MIESAGRAPDYVNATAQPVRDADGNLRGDTIAPRIAMREGGGRTDRLYLPPAHFSLDGESGQMVMPGLGDGNSTSRIPPATPSE